MLAPPAFVPCEPRRARSVGGLINNRYANGRLGQNEEISIIFDRNFARWMIRGRGPDNLWQGVNDALRQTTQVGPATQKSRPRQWPDCSGPFYLKNFEGFESRQRKLAGRSSPHWEALILRSTSEQAAWKGGGLILLT